jgi:alkylation response protein AidB-like acyl-CoA dehydrogenase
VSYHRLVIDAVSHPSAPRLGDVGAGWAQNTGELALERGGVDRWMSLMPYLAHWARTAEEKGGSAALAELGSITARLWAFRGLSLSIARMVDRGLSPSVEAALVKEMATRFEQECLDVVVRHLGRAPQLDSDDLYEALLAQAVLTAPSWTIRGGTNEILRTVIMKGMGRG